MTLANLGWFWCCALGGSHLKTHPCCELLLLPGAEILTWMPKKSWLDLLSPSTSPVKGPRILGVRTWDSWGPSVPAQIAKTLPREVVQELLESLSWDILVGAKR